MTVDRPRFVSRRGLLAAALIVPLFLALEYGDQWAQHRLGLLRVAKHTWWFGSLDAWVYSVALALAAFLVGGQAKRAAPFRVALWGIAPFAIVLLGLAIASSSGSPLREALDLGRIFAGYLLSAHLAAAASLYLANLIERTPA